jgi:hypothetical protein
MTFAQRQAEEEALNRPIAAAQYLQALARGMSNNDVDLDHPPSDLTADQSAVIDYVRSTPALRNALDVAGIGGKADGSSQLTTAMSSWTTHATMPMRPARPITPISGRTRTQIGNPVS